MAKKDDSAKQTSIGPPGKAATAGGVVRCISVCKPSVQQVEPGLADLTRLHDLSTRLLAVDGLRPLFQEIMDAAVALVGAERGTLQLVEGDSLRIVAHHGHQPPFLKFFASAETQASVCGEALKCGERVIVEDVTRSPLFAGTVSAIVLQAAGVRAVQSTPLRTRQGKLLGVLTTQWSVPHVPDEHDLWRIDLLARQTADLIEHRQAAEALHKATEELQVRTEQLQTLHDSLCTRRKELETAQGDLRAQQQELRSQHEMLRQGEQRYRTLFETAPDAIVVHKDGRFLEANDAALYLTGAGTFEELATHSVLDFFRPEDREQAAERLREAMAGRKLPVREATLRRLDGQEVVVEFHTARVDFHGVQAVQTIVRDITERRQAEEELRRREVELRTITDNAPEIIARVDHQLRHLFINPAITRITGKSVEEYLGKTNEELGYPAELCALWSATFRKVFETGQPGELEFTFGAPSGPLHLSMRAVPEFGADGAAESVLFITTDITKHKRAEEALRESEQRLALAASGTRIGMYDWNPTTGETFWTEQLARLLGLCTTTTATTTTTTTISQRYHYHDWSERVHPEDRPRVEAELRRCRAEQTPFELEYRVVWPDGSVHWVADRGVFQYESATCSTRILGILMDITERQRAEGAVRSVALFPAQNPSPTLRVARNGALLYANPASARLLESWNIRTGQSVPAEIGQQVVQALDGDKSGEVEVACGSALYSFSIAPIVSDDYANLYGRDITQRKEAEEKLRENQTILKTIIESTADYISLKDREGRYVMMNSVAAERLRESTGLAAAEIIGKRDDEIFPCEIARSVIEADRQVVTSGKTHALDQSFTFRHERRTFSTIKSPYCDTTGNVAGVVNFSRDITERKRAEEALRELNATLEGKVAERTAELQRRAKQLQRLMLELAQAEEQERRRIAVILHEDLQQRIAGAKFHLNLVKGRAKDDRMQTDLEEVDAMLKGAIEQSRHLSHDLSPAVMNMNDLAEVLRWLAHRVQAQHGISVTVKVCGNMILHSEALATFLFRAAQELLFNVINHAYVREAAIRARRAGRYVRVSVSDQGRGFDPQELKETPGIGLFSIRERIELLGGRMKIKSVPGKGSRFDIMVPDSPLVKDGEKTTRAVPYLLAPGPSPSCHGALRVLLVDDHKIVREGLAAMLRGTPGVELVGEAPDGREGINMAVNLQPDVVIMDVSMPLMKGDEATWQIKKYLPQTRVIALSMYDDADKKESMFQAGAESYILKTVSAEELLAAIRGRESDWQRTSPQPTI